MSRKRTYEIIEKAESKDKLSAIYDGFMMVVIIISLVPLAFKEDTPLLMVADKVTVVIFIIDYLSELFFFHRNFILKWKEIDILFDRAYK